MEVKERIKILRGFMEEKGMDAYIIPSSDAHQSEYVAEHFKCREWISGFTGSAGTVVITLKEAGLWTDGRYYIQAEKQLSGTGIKLFRAADIGVPSYTVWLRDNLNNGSCVGFDGTLLSVNQVKEMQKEFECKNLVLNTEFDLINMIWTNRPALPNNEIFLHELKYAGKSYLDKLKEVRISLKAIGGNYLFLSSLDDIAWLFNIRGTDVANNPVAIAYAIVGEKESYLFVEAVGITKLSEEARQQFSNDGIVIKGYNEISKSLKEISENSKVIMDFSKTNYNLYNVAKGKAKIIDTPNITTKLKAIKNDVEINNLKECQLRDGVILVKLIKWIKEKTDGKEINEIDVSDKLIQLRKEYELFVQPSFDSIVGYKANAAMMHYKALPNTAAVLKKEGMLLIDTGGQYYNGTTDTTRTLVLGEISNEEKRDFTLVLKGNIALSRIKFLYGATGSNLDVIARQPIWAEGMDYKCGTGHGVGFFLNVHEGPHRIAMAVNDVKLEAGMVITNEPGIYKEGRHGIRTENMLLVVKEKETEFGSFMAFETLTFCPIDLEGVDNSMLTYDEVEWLNNYHQKVYQNLVPLLTDEEKKWLLLETKPINLNE